MHDGLGDLLTATIDWPVSAFVGKAARKSAVCADVTPTVVNFAVDGAPLSITFLIRALGLPNKLRAAPSNATASRATCVLIRRQHRIPDGEAHLYR